MNLNLIERFCLIILSASFNFSMEKIILACKLKAYIHLFRLRSINTYYYNVYIMILYNIMHAFDHYYLINENIFNFSQFQI